MPARRPQDYRQVQNPVPATDARFSPRPRTIAVDIDDTLNDFSQTLSTHPFPFDPSYALPEGRFRLYLERTRAGAPEPGDLLSTEFAYFRFRIHEQCFRAARPREGAADFLRRLKSAGWRIVICTRRDLRRAAEATNAWLADNRMSFDDLFMAQNKVAFCRAWSIGHLVDDDPFSIVHGPPLGVNVYAPATGPHPPPPEGPARRFSSFPELAQWILG